MKNVIIETYPEIDYALIARVKEDNTTYEFVAAYGYDPKTEDWVQGHYFRKIKDAIRFIDEKVTEYIFRDFL